MLGALPLEESVGVIVQGVVSSDIQGMAPQTSGLDPMFAVLQGPQACTFFKSKAGFKTQVKTFFFFINLTMLTYCFS